MIGTLISYVILTILVRSEVRKKVLVSLIPLTIATLAFVPILIYMQTRSFWGYIKSIWNTSISNLNISKIFLLEPSLSLLVQRWAGGAYGNPLIIALAILGMIAMADLTKRFNRLILCWIMVPSLVMLAIVPGSECLYWRVAYVFPFHIPAAIGLRWLINKLRSTLASTSTATITYFRLFQIFLITIVMLLLFNYTLRTVDQAMIQTP